MRSLLVLGTVAAACLATVGAANAAPSPPEGALYAPAAAHVGEPLDMVAFYNQAAQKKHPWLDYECRQEGRLTQSEADLSFFPLEEKKADGRFTTFSSDAFITINEPSTCSALLGVPAKEKGLTEVLDQAQFTVTP
jgi:hypothetical protein